MANRILINSSGMKISDVGVNVLSADPGQMIFNSDFGGLTVGSRGSYYVGGFGNHYITLPRAFGTNALILAEASGQMLGGVRTVGQTKRNYFGGIGSESSFWRLALVDAYTLMCRHTDYPNSGAWPPGTFAPAGPAFPYYLNYAVLDA